MSMTNLKIPGTPPYGAIPPIMLNKTYDPELGKPEDKAIAFITFDEKKGFVINEEAEAFLCSLPKDQSVGVISTVGKYRTGKSFFINRVLLGRETKGFNVGPTINPCTKGLWIWKNLVNADNTDFPDMKVLIIDTEGFGGMDEDVNHDSRIFLFSLLLSSYFIYNSSGNIDENALNGLSLIINLAKDIQVKTVKGSNSEEAAQFFPAFLWVVRDFTLKIVDQGGNKITSKDYLEKALELQKGVSDMIESKNKIRRLVKHFFADRDCITLIRPLEEEQKLQKLDTIKNTELRPEFVDQIIKARQKIYKKIKPKVLNQKTFNSSMFLELARAYVEAINTGGVPNIEQAWRSLIKNESSKILQETIRTMENSIESIMKSPMAHDPNNIKDIKRELAEKTIKQFRRRAIGMDEDLQDYVHILSENFKDKFKKVKEKNAENWKKVYDDYCKSPVGLIEDKLRHGQYSNYYEFQVELNKLRENFQKDAPNGPQKDQFWKELSEKIYSTAAEYISRNSENVIMTETKKLRNQVNRLEEEQEEKRKNWDREREELEKKILSFEKEKYMRGDADESKFEELKKEKEKLEKSYSEAKEAIKKKDKEIKKCEGKLEIIKKEHEKIVSGFESKKESANQELQSEKSEKMALQSRLSSVENDRNSLTIQLNEQKTLNDHLKSEINRMEMLKNQEIMMIRSENEKKFLEFSMSNKNNLRTETVVVKEPDNSGWLSEKKDMESMISFLRGQIDGNKKLHDAFIIHLQQKDQGKNNVEYLSLKNSNELAQTNKTLTRAFEKLEARLKEFEEKNRGLKYFKKIVKNSSCVQCLHCNKYIKVTGFVTHLQNCVPSQVDQRFEDFPSPLKYSNSAESGSNQAIIVAESPARNESPRPVESSKEIQEFSSPLSQRNLMEEKFDKYFSFGDKNITNRSYLDQCDLIIQDKEYQKPGTSQISDKDKIRRLFPENSSRNPLSDLKVSVGDIAIKELADKSILVEFGVICSVEKHQWKVFKQMSDFADLNGKLNMAYQNEKMTLFYSTCLCNNNKDYNEKKKLCNQFLQDLCKLEKMRNSNIFQDFLETRKNIPADLWNRVLSFQDNFLPEDLYSSPLRTKPKQSSNATSITEPKRAKLTPTSSSDRQTPVSPENFLRNWNKETENLNSSGYKRDGNRKRMLSENWAARSPLEEDITIIDSLLKSERDQSSSKITPLQKQLNNLFSKNENPSSSNLTKSYLSNGFIGKIEKPPLYAGVNKSHLYNTERKPSPHTSNPLYNVDTQKKARGYDSVQLERQALLFKEKSYK